MYNIQWFLSLDEQYMPNNDQQYRMQHLSLSLSSLSDSGFSKTTNADWNEFDHRDIIAKYEPRYANLDELKKDIFLDSNPKEKITEVLKGSVIRWTSGLYNDYNESWSAFCM